MVYQIEGSEWCSRPAYQKQHQYSTAGIPRGKVEETQDRKKMTPSFLTTHRIVWSVP